MVKIGERIFEFPPLFEGVLIRRYKRFLADIQLDSGEMVTAHCANTGPMKGVLIPGGKVRLKFAPSPKRKLDWSWEQSEVEGEENGSACWVGVNTSLPNKLIRKTIEEECLHNQLGPIKSIRQEVVYGLDRKSRIDLLLEPGITNQDNRLIYVEVKNTTWKEGSFGLFPDTVTTRGQKHLKELMGVCSQSRSILVPCISRIDVEIFAPGDTADSMYGNLFREALQKGVEVIPCCFGFYRDHITWEGVKPFRKFAND